MNTVSQALAVGYSWGMYQHEREIRELADIVSKHQVRTVVEIGVHRGGTSAMWCQLVGPEGLVVGVDLPDGHWGGIGVPGADIRDAHLVAQFPWYRPVRGNSHEPSTLEAVVTALLGRKVDLLFIDGDHSLKGVHQDFDMYSKLVRERGLVAFHDVIDTERHRKDGVEVPEFWQSMVAWPGYTTRTINDNQGWGGIGVMALDGGLL